MNAFIVEETFHHAVARLPTGFVVYLLDQLKRGSLGFSAGVPAVLPVVVVGIRTNTYMLQ